MLIKACLNGETTRQQHSAVPQTPEELATDAAAMVLDRHGLTAPRLHHGYGAATWPVLRAAIAWGRDIRVGLEDTTILADDRLASGNAELVTVAASLAAVAGPPIRLARPAFVTIRLATLPVRR